MLGTVFEGVQQQVTRLSSTSARAHSAGTSFTEFSLAVRVMSVPPSEGRLFFMMMVMSLIQWISP